MSSCTCETPASTNSAPKAQETHVDTICEKLNGPALLVHCVWGEKGCYENWKSYGLDRMQDPKYLARLLRGNIGVVQGDVSAGLCSVDIDVENDVAAFLELNPRFKDTLMSKGKRGCNIWFRLRGKCPRTRVLKRHGDKWGELRANGSQTIIYGKHPEGPRYSWPQKCKVIEIDSMNAIKWLPGTTMGRVKLRSKETHEADASQAVQEADAVYATDAADVAHAVNADHATKVISTNSLSVAVVGSLPAFPGEFVTENLPRQKGNNHELLFKLARRVFTFEKQHSGKYSTGELSGIFNSWYGSADKQFLRDSKIDYFTEFLNAYKGVKVAIGEAVFERAWENAQRATVPPEVMAIYGEFDEFQKLACLCRELQREFGVEPFFLSCRTVAQLFGIAPKTAWKRLICLEKFGFIKTVEKGGLSTYLASRFKYLHPLT
jgi:hypothetical protein